MERVQTFVMKKFDQGSELAACMSGRNNSGKW